MKDRHVLPLSVITALLVGVALLPGCAFAQQKSLRDQLVGTWTLLSWDTVNADGSKALPPFEGANLKGMLMFDGGGRFSFQAMTEHAKFKISDRMKATAEENNAVLRGILSYFGTYTVNDTDRSLNFLVERSSFPNQVGAEQKRVITVLTADELKFTNLGRLAGGQNYFAFKRAQ
jgi:lipocalin-like protein